MARKTLARPFPARLRELRKSRDMTLVELAERCGGVPTVSSISEYERGQKQPTLSALQSLAKGLGITVGELVD